MEKIGIKSMEKHYETYKNLKRKYDEEIELIEKEYKNEDKIAERVLRLVKPEFTFPKKSFRSK